MRACAHTRTLTHSQTRTHSLSLTHSLTHSLTRSATFERAERARVALSPHPICSPLPLKWDAMIHIWCSMPLSSPTPVPDSSGCHSCIRSLTLALIPNLPQSHPGSRYHTHSLPLTRSLGHDCSNYSDVFIAHDTSTRIGLEGEI